MNWQKIAAIALLLGAVKVWTEHQERVAQQEGVKYLARIADAADGKEIEKHFVWICKRFPPRGQKDWERWLYDNGDCELAQGERR